MSDYSNPIEVAARILRHGGLVAFPTETVYGLGADATNASAVARIYSAKGRPSTNPLICHVADATIAKRYVCTWPTTADRLTQAFWPGPLTLVLPRLDAPDGVVAEATAGRPTVALRVPDHPIALDLLRAFGGPVAAPSANRSTRVSPTIAQHVRDELGDELALGMILDGGPCTIGIESTVLDLTTTPPTILRPGGISQRQIEELIGPVAVFTGHVAVTDAAPCPGQHAVHYAPRTPTYRFDSQDWATLARIQLSARSVVLHLSPTPQHVAGRAVCMPQSPAAYAASLYAILRHWDDQVVESIVIEMPPDEPQWVAVRDRLLRASTAGSRPSQAPVPA